MNIVFHKYKDDNKNISVFNGKKELRKNYFMKEDYELMKYPKSLNHFSIALKYAERLFKVSDILEGDYYFKEINVIPSLSEILRFDVTYVDNNVILSATYEDDNTFNPSITIAQDITDSELVDMVIKQATDNIGILIELFDNSDDWLYYKNCIKKRP